MPPRERARDLACLALLGLAVAAFFWPLILTEAWIPRGGGDLVSFLWPTYHFAARSLRSGTVPLWNPHLYSGAPFVADNQSGVFYPINLVAFCAAGPPSYAVMEGLVVLHVWIAAATMFGLLRGLGLQRAAAITGGLAFSLSDLFVTHLGNLNLNATAAWLPLVLWFTHRALTRKSLAWAAAAGAALTVAALAGHAQILLFAGLTVALIVIYHMVRLVANGRRPIGRALAETVGLALLIAVVGIGGAAFTLLPAYQMAGHTGRGQLPFQEATRYSLPPRALIGLLAPGFYGRGPGGFWGPWERVEVGYAGVGTLLLAAFGLVVHLGEARPGASGSQPPDPGQRESPRTFPVAFFALLVPVALLLAMGRYTPAYGFLYRWIPTFDQIRAPARLIVLADLGLASLAAYGLDRLLEPGSGRRRPRRWVGLGALVAAALVLAFGLPQAATVPPPDRVAQATRGLVASAALLALNGSLIVLAVRERWTGWLFPLVLAVDLIALGSTLEIEPHDPTRGFRHADVVAYLEEDPSLFRIEDAASAWQPDAALMHGLYDIGGVYNPLALAPYEAYRWALGRRGAPLYNLLGVKYVLADKGKPPGDERLVPVYTAAPEIDVYLNTAALPRALFVTSQQVVSDHTEAWKAIHAPEFDPVETIVLERNQALEPSEQASSRESAAVPGEAAQIAFAGYGLNAVELTVEAPTDGWLLLSDVYYPGWRASIDGIRTPVLRADYTFRAVSVPAGSHTVRMTFAPWTWQVGLGLSLGTWLGLAAGAILRLRRPACRLMRLVKGVHV
ncbi:MAG: YfhO family protein [Chloroflexota bacterium]|nr:YfhO family protein [Chloroflexota bacterium]